MQGKIIKGIAGFYYVHTDGAGVCECKAKGIFRKDKIKPLVGDDVELELTDETAQTGNVTRILPRRSELVRPAVANIDQALIIFALARPEPNYNLLDRFLIMMRRQGLDCIICFNKKDIAPSGACDVIRDTYGRAGYRMLCVSALLGEGIGELREALAGRTTAVAGPSGVGKSSLINSLLQESRMETGAISKKIERGRHTTRHSELLAVSEHTYIMDTPGFSSLSLFDMEKEELAACYPEFEPYEEQCRFSPCAHIREPVCGVKAALERGELSRLRYDNYVSFYEELKEQEKRKY